MLSPGFPSSMTVQRYFYAWRDAGVWQTINHYLLMAIREAEGREASPNAGVIDSQSVKIAESGGVRGYDAGKKIKGRKSHILPRRWVIERRFAWIGRNRRLAKEFENTTESATTWLFMASVQLITQKIVSSCSYAG
jgi:transposase